MKKPHTGGHNGGRPKRQTEPGKGVKIPASVHGRVVSYAEEKGWGVAQTLSYLVERCLDDIGRREKKIA